MAAFVIDKLQDERSFTSVAREVNLSVSTVIRVFELVSYPKPNLPYALSIDEFKGNAGGEKYLCILTDPVNKVVLDILPQRYEHYLTNYFKTYPRADRMLVHYFVSDMWKNYSDITNGFTEGCNNKIKILKKKRIRLQEFQAFQKPYFTYIFAIT